MESYFGSFEIGRILFLRSLAALYLIAFISALNQFPALLGAKGLLPVTDFIRQVPFKHAPSLFYWHYSDLFFSCMAWLGAGLSALAVFGVTEKAPWWLSLIVWLAMWAIYLSIVNIGQTFYSFGWESMLLEAGFFAAFCGSSRWAAALIPLLILRWMLFRVELGAGLIKLRNDECWRNLTCLYYHHETQPMPNPFSWYFHHLPKWIHQASVAFSHFVQVIVPFGLFAPQRIAAAAGILIIFHQLLLIVSGNYSWLNWLTVILGLTALSDSFFSLFLNIKSATGAARSYAYDAVVYALAALTLWLSIQPTLNFFARRQMMNYNYNPFHLVGSYGAFGSVTKQRYEIILEGTEDERAAPGSWKEYEFKGKPGDVMRRPPQVAPYHLRLDWLMWFLPFSVSVSQNSVHVPGYEMWFIRFARKLLDADKLTLRLLRKDPFEGRAPRFIRARYYLYRFTTKAEHKETGAWWNRTLVGEYLPPIAAKDLQT